MNTKRIISSEKHKGEVNRVYKYGLAFCNESARSALCKFPKEIVNVLNLYVFAVNEYGEVILFTSGKFRKKYDESAFFLRPLDSYKD